MTTLLVVAVMGYGCDRRAQQLPPVRTPVRMRVACVPPKPVSTLTVVPPAGHSCGLALPECGQARPLVIQLDERGEIVGAYIRGNRCRETRPLRPRGGASI